MKQRYGWSTLIAEEITVKQLTREALVELVDKIYVYPEQKIDIYFKFASVESSPDRILEKDGVI